MFAETGFGWLYKLYRKMPAVEPKPKPQADDIGINAILLGPPGAYFFLWSFGVLRNVFFLNK